MGLLEGMILCIIEGDESAQSVQNKCFDPVQTEHADRARCNNKSVKRHEARRAFCTDAKTSCLKTEHAKKKKYTMLKTGRWCTHRTQLNVFYGF